LSKSKGSQVVVLMVPTTQPEDIASYANRVGNTWKIGRKDVGDGLLLVVAKDDRKVRIEVAKTLEGAIPTWPPSRSSTRPSRQPSVSGDYAGGLDAAADRVIALIRGEALPARPPPRGRGGDLGFDWEDLPIFMFFAVPVVRRVRCARIFGRKLGSLLTGAGVGGLAWLFTRQPAGGRRRSAGSTAGWAVFEPQPGAITRGSRRGGLGAAGAGVAAVRWLERWLGGRLQLRRRRRLWGRRRLGRTGDVGQTATPVQAPLAGRARRPARRAARLVQRLMQRVAASERRHSGEIRIHVEAACR
jgi:uncharacterized protein